MRFILHLFLTIVWILSASVFANEFDEGHAVPVSGGINTSNNEFGLSITEDGQFIYYYSKRENNNYSDLLRSRKNGLLWSQGEVIPELNSNYDDQSPNILDHEQKILFSSNRDGAIEFKLQNGKIGVSRDIYYSRKEKGKWLPPIPLPGSINTERIEETPYLFGKYLYFIRYPFGQPYLGDIYRSEYKDGAWQQVTRLPEPINTENSELGVSVSKDGKWLYFSSNRKGGKGGMDIYRAAILQNGSFGPPENLGEAVNTEGDEAFFVPEIGGNGFLFARRAQDKKDYDVYQWIPGKPQSWKDLSEGKKLTVRSIHFDRGSALIKADSLPTLDELTGYLETHPKIRLKITGHTDLNGNPKDNQILSEERAVAVKGYLLGKGISAGRIETEGKGSSEPVIDKIDPETDEQNRRTEFEVLR